MNKPKSIVLCSAFALMLLLVSGGCGKDDPKSSEKQVLSFGFASTVPTVTAIIDQNLHTITATVPGGSSLTALVPTITVSDGATVSPGSGVAQNFTLPVVYTVIAEDGSQATYIATITVDGSGDPETLSGSMSANRTLTNRNNSMDYIIDGGFYLEGNALLTVEPGVKILFSGVNSYIEVGENAGLKMVGTADKPIILAGPVNNPNKGSWGGIRYFSARADNQMEYVQILNAGPTEDGCSVYIRSDAALSVKNTLVSGSLGYGFEVYGKFNAFSSNTVSDCGTVPVYATEIKLLASMDQTSTFTNNAKNYVEVAWSTTDNDITINNLTIPYYFANGLYAEKNLTIKAGAQLLFNRESALSIPESAKLIAEGTSTAGILFSSLDKEAGTWSGISIQSEFSNSMTYCTVEYGGYGSDGYNIDCHGKLAISNTTIRNSAKYGFITYDSNTVTASSVIFSACALGNIYNWDTGEVSDNF
ncbi:MAG: DUF5018 domain-containing protein [Bacteroidales bacterium]|nr:DUF5018 domain-containing protein [Bacteroidales bacterium]